MNAHFRPPLIMPIADPEESKKSRSLTMNLYRLAESVEEFKYSLALYDHTAHNLAVAYQNYQNLSNIKRKIKPQSGLFIKNGIEDSSVVSGKVSRELLLRESAWKRIAVHDGAVKLYYFAKAVKACMKFLSVCPTVQLEVEPGDIQLIWNKFEQDFPYWKDCRNAVTHEGDIIGDEIEKHTTKESYSSDAVTAPPGNLITEMRGRVFSTTWQGRIVKYEISEQTLIKLQNITNQIYYLFDPHSGLDSRLIESDHPGDGRYGLQARRREAMKARRIAAKVSEG